MLESLLNDIYSINPLLGNFVKLSFISLVVMVSIIPISFFINLLNSAMSEIFLKVDHYFNSVLAKLINNIQVIIKGFKEFFDKLIKNNQIITEEELITQKIETDNISKNLNQISAELTVIPGMITGKNGKGEEGINQYKEELDKLSKLKLSKLKLNIPEMRLDLSKEKIAKNSFSTLVILLPLLILCIVGNTMLLNKVFYEALEVQERLLRTDFFGLLKDRISINMSIILAFLFTLLETGIGFTLGVITFNKDQAYEGKSEKEINVVVEKICWYLFPVFAIFEAVCYFILSTYLLASRKEVETNELFEAGELIFVEYFELAAFPIIGILIVGGLFILGKFVTINFKKSRDSLESKRIKNDLDNERRKMDSINENLNTINNNAKNLANTIKDIQIQKIASEPISKTLSNLSKKIKQIFDDTNKEISRVKKNVKDFIGGKVEKKLPSERVKMHIYSNMKNIFIFIVGCVALYYTFPGEVFIPGIKEIDSNIIWIITLLYPFFLTAFGNQLSTRKRFIIGEDEKEQIHDPNTMLIKTIGYAGIVVMIVFLFLLHYKFSDSNFIGLALAISSCFGFLYVGYNLVHTMPSVTLLTRSVYTLILILLNAVTAGISYIIGRLFNVTKSLLDIGSYPARKIILYVRGK